MGAWGLGNFENDDALDYLVELETEYGAELIVAALNDALVDGYLEMPEASAALVAAEALAAKNMKPRADLPVEIRDWVGRARFPLTEQLLKRARAAVARVASDSELAEESTCQPNADEWLAELADLMERLDAS